MANRGKGQKGKKKPEPESLVVPAGWLEKASDLLAEPDPGSPPYLVDQLVHDRAICAIGGPYKVGKTFVGLELILAVTGARPAFGRYEADEPGTVAAVFEESGRAALHRRLKALKKGHEIDDDTFDQAMDRLVFAANRGVQLGDAEWKERLSNDLSDLDDLRLVLFDPFVRMKGDADENHQSEIAPILDFLRQLRNDTDAAVAYVQHAGHEGNRMRGTSDFGGFWESLLTIQGEPFSGGPFTLKAAHREAESTTELKYRIVGSSEEQWVRLEAEDAGKAGPSKSEQRRDEIHAFVEANPGHTTAEIRKKLTGKKQAVLRSLEWLEQEGLVYWSHPGSPEHPSGTVGTDRNSRKRKEWFSGSVKPNTTVPNERDGTGWDPTGPSVPGAIKPGTGTGQSKSRKGKAGKKRAKSKAKSRTSRGEKS